MAPPDGTPRRDAGPPSPAVRCSDVPTEPPQRAWTAALFFAAPGVVVALVGFTRPQHLTTDTAAHWWLMHVAQLPMFPCSPSRWRSWCAAGRP